MTNDYILTTSEDVKLETTEVNSEISSLTTSENSFTEVCLGGKRKKVPKRVLQFSDGILEEYSSDEDEFDSFNDKKPLINPETLSWFPYLWYLTWWLGSRTLAVCDYLGEHLAYFFGITSPKYYYELQEYNRMIEEDKQEQRENLEATAGWKSSANIELKKVQVQEPTNSQFEINGTALITKQVSSSESQHWERY